MFDVEGIEWSESHGVVGKHQGAGVLYFGLPYMLRAKRCVCLGSGAGFVPLMMLSAQKRLITEGLLDKTDVVLVDADIGIWGRPVYQSGDDINSNIHLIKKLTSDAVHELSDINYLHVDADHSYEGVLEDLENYYNSMSGDWAITVHDTHNESNQHLPIGSWEAAKEFSSRHNLSLSNFRVGCGTALIRKQDGG
jgi:hypothetical protein